MTSVFENHFELIQNLSDIRVQHVLVRVDTREGGRLAECLRGLTCQMVLEQR